MTAPLFRRLVMMAVFFGAALAAPAQDLDRVRGQMRDRLPQVDALKASGAIGEDNRGFLSVRESRENAAEIVQAENADRRVVYDSIASKTGTTADAVGRARAQKIAAQSASGVWLQGEDGSWYQK